jgi:ATP-dependent RNA helicase DeaD
MSQGSRDGVMISFKGGRVRFLVATDVAARGLDISTVTHIINYDVPTSPDVYVHRIGRTGRVGRSGRAITFVESRQRRELEAIERHINSDITPWSPGATTKPTPVEEKPKRHSKPHVARNGSEEHVTLMLNVGSSTGVEIADVVHAITDGAGLDGEAVSNVRVLSRFAFADVPADEAERVIKQVSGQTVAGAELALTRAR